MPEIQVHWELDGQGQDEAWPSLDAFLAWCAGEGLAPRWTAYEEDDGDWIPFASGVGQRVTARG